MAKQKKGDREGISWTDDSLEKYPGSVCLGPRPPVYAVKPKPSDPNLSGTEAMGLVIPYERKTEALEHMRDMAPNRTAEWYMDCINKVSYELEHDQPYEAMKAGSLFLDLTGVYRLFSALLTPPDGYKSNQEVDYISLLENSGMI